MAIDKWGDLVNNILSLKLNENSENPFIIDNAKFDCVDNSIIFNYDKVIYRINYKKQLFIRENEEFYFELDFKNKKSLYKLKNANITLDIKVIKCNFLQKRDSILMKYVIESSSTENNIMINIIKGEIIW